LFLALNGLARRPIIAAVCVTPFAFTGPNLWFFSNTYSWDVFWHYLWVLELWILTRPRLRKSPGWMAGLVVVHFALTYSEYQGALFAAGIALGQILFLRQDPRFRRASLAILVSTIAALATVFVQYAGLAGPGAFVDVFLAQGLSRSLLSIDVNPLRLIGHYLYGYGPLAIATGVALIFFVRRSGGSKAAWSRLDPTEQLLVFAVGFTVVTHHGALLQWSSVHTYAVLKGSVLISLVLFVIATRLETRDRLGPVLALVLACVASSAVTYAHFVRTPDADRYRRLGTDIAAIAESGIPLYAAVAEASRPQVTYYARRTVHSQGINGTTDALDHMASSGRPEALFLRIDETLRVIGVDRLRADSREP